MQYQCGKCLGVVSMTDSFCGSCGGTLESLSDSSIPQEAYVRLSKSYDIEHKIWLTLTTRGTKKAFYTLVDDGWFRISGPTAGSGYGYGLMLRSLKHRGRVANDDGVNWGSRFSTYKATFTYLPSAYGGNDADDIPANWDKANGRLYIRDSLNIQPGDVANYVAQNAHLWVP